MESIRGKKMDLVDAL